MLKINTLENNERMSTQDLLQAINAAIEAGETEFSIEASGQHDIGGPPRRQDVLLGHPGMLGDHPDNFVDAHPLGVGIAHQVANGVLGHVAVHRAWRDGLDPGA